MIELRWVWKEQDSGLITSDMKVSDQSLHPVLQYRACWPHQIEGHLWTGWKDVPLPPMPIDE